MALVALAAVVLCGCQRQAAIPASRPASTTAATALPVTAVSVPERTGSPLANELTAPAVPPASQTATPAGSRSRVPLVVFGAGSLIGPFDKLERAFEAANPDIDVQAQYHGSIQVIRHATELHEPIDVVATADASLVPMLMYGTQDPATGKPYADWYIRFASNRLALAYGPGSKYAGEITADNWPEVLARPDVRVGLPDPRFDAAGYRGLMAAALTGERTGHYDYFRKLFDAQFLMPVTIFLEDDRSTITVPEVLESRSGGHILVRGASIQLVALLESGDLDYTFEYESVSRQHGLKWLSLNDQDNLGSAEWDATYGRVQVNLDFRRFATVQPRFRGERIGYGITVPASAPHPAEAVRFIAFLLGPEGRAVMQADYHPLFDRPLADGYDHMPAELQALCDPVSTP